MTLLLTFLLGMVCVSAALYAGARLFLHLDERAEQWPLLWATGLLLSVLIPLAGIALVLMPDWAPTPSFEILSLHEPLNSLGHSLGFIPDLEPTTAYSAEIVTLATARKFLAVIYLIGVALNLVKLAFGRVRIHPPDRRGGPRSARGAETTFYSRPPPNRPLLGPLSASRNIPESSFPKAIRGK